MDLAVGERRFSPPKPPSPPAARRVGAGAEAARPPKGGPPVPADDDGWICPPAVKLTDGTTIQLYKDGEGLHAAYQAIERAKRIIGLEVYIFADDETGHAFADLLCKKAKEGVRVFLIYDAFGTRGFFGAEPEMFQRMRNASVRVRVFHPMRPWESQFGWRPVNRDHRKLLVVDGSAAWLGGLNIGREYGGSWISQRAQKCHFWRDNAIAINGPGCKLFTHAFDHTWKYVTRGGRIRRAEFIEHRFDGEMGVMSVVPTLDSPLRPSLHYLLRQAKQSILMTMAYFAPDDPLIEGLCKAAQRGVRVRLMLPGICDVPAVQTCARAFYEKLMSCGVQIYERQGVILHAKIMVVDDHTSIIGSTNLDYRSIEYNCELSAIIRSNEFAKQLNALFENDVQFACEMKLAEWRRRPQWDRFVQWAVSRARYLL